MLDRFVNSFGICWVSLWGEQTEKIFHGGFLGGLEREENRPKEENGGKWGGIYWTIAKWFAFFRSGGEKGENSDEPAFPPAFPFLSSLGFVPEEDFFSCGVVWCVFDAHGCKMFGWVARGCRERMRESMLWRRLIEFWGFSWEMMRKWIFFERHGVVRDGACRCGWCFRLVFCWKCWETVERKNEKNF